MNAFPEAKHFEGLPQEKAQDAFDRMRVFFHGGTREHTASKDGEELDAITVCMRPEDRPRVAKALTALMAQLQTMKRPEMR